MAEISEQTKGNVNIENPLTRIAVAAFISVFTTFAILWVMQILIATGKGQFLQSTKEDLLILFVLKKMKILIQKTLSQKNHQNPKSHHQIHPRN